MTCKESLYAILAPIFGNEVYPVRHPDPDGSISSVSDDFCIYSVVGGQTFPTLQGDTGVSRIRMQISIYCMDFDRMEEFSESVRTAMLAANDLYNLAVTNKTDLYNTLGTQANVLATIPNSGYEADTKRFYTHIDYYLWEVL